jgi:hypothetical protein
MSAMHRSGTGAAESAMRYVAPVGEKDAYVSRAIKNVAQFLPTLAGSVE